MAVAFNRGDVDAVRELITDDIVYRLPGSSVLAGTYTGEDAVLSAAMRLVTLTDGTIQAEVHDVVANDSARRAHPAVQGSAG